MKKLLLALALAAAPFSLAASPAQDLFDQASYYLEFYYNGPSALNLKDLSQRYQAQLDQACSAQKDTCPYPQAEALIRQMVRELDDGHTYYQTPAELRRSQASREGGATSEVPRIGLSHREVPGSRDRVVLDVVENSPAREAGILYGDRIVGINGRLLAEFATDTQVAEFLNQQVQTGQPVKLSLVRGPQRQKLEISVTGRPISLTRLPSLNISEAGVATLRIPEFFPNGQVGSRVHQLVREAQEKSAKAMILDLRGNPGGLATEALIAMAAFTDDPYVAFADKYGADRTVYAIRNGQLTVSGSEGADLGGTRLPYLARWRGPLAVLVDSGSASGAEYLASAIQLAKTGVVVGEPTVGIGNTTTRPLPLINGGAINISFNRAFLADGSGYPARVKPNLEVADNLLELANNGRDVVVERALQALGLQAAVN